MKTKIISLVLVILTILTLVGSAFGSCDGCDGDYEEPGDIPVLNCEVEIDGDEVSPDRETRIKVERGEELDIKVRVKALEDVEDVQVDAMISGYDRDSIQDSSGTFDLDENDIEKVYLTLKIPDDIDLTDDDDDDDDEFKLRIFVTNKFGAAQTYSYNLRIAAPDNNVVIKDIILDPSYEVVAGRGLLASVRVKNMGEDDQDDIKVTVSIPALGIDASEYIEELEYDESTSSEDLYLRIPQNAETGTYVVKARVKYDSGDEIVSEETSINIVGEDFPEPEEDEDKTVVTVPERQDVDQGSSIAYPIMISNTGATAKTYTLAVNGVESWGSYRMDPSNVLVIDGKKTKTAYLYVTAEEDASVGDKVFIVSVESAGQTKDVPLTASIMQGEEEPKPPISGDWESIKKGLEIGLIVLVVLLVLLGLIVGFNKLKGAEEEEPEEISGQTYY
jgi:hypothetical protein